MSGDPFLFDYQIEAVEKMRNGCILNGGTGSGKSRTGLYYYFHTVCGGDISYEHYAPMKQPKDLYIITTAMKRDKHEWELEMGPYLLSPDPEATPYQIKVAVDSWQNIQKYKDVSNAFFIFDEDRVTGSGQWVKAFWKIAEKNQWIILSATPGDNWMDYFPVFKANGFFKTKKEFEDNHVVYDWRAKFPGKVDRYVGITRLLRLRERILIDMDFHRRTVQHHEDVIVRYNIDLYRSVGKQRWNPFLDKPIETAAELCYTWRKVVNSDLSRQIALLELYEDHPKMIVFYNFDYELDLLKELYYGDDVEIAEWNGHKHQPVPDSERWVYLVQYTAGAEAWNCITTDTIVFYSQNYSYKTMEQATGRIDRMNTPFTDLYYYHFRSNAAIDLGIRRALVEKKRFNETRFVGGAFVGNKQKREKNYGKMAGACTPNVA